MSTKSYVKKLIESNKRVKENAEYIKENFTGIYPLGVMFKKHQSQLVDTFVSALKVNYETFPMDVKSKTSLENFGKISFKEEGESFSVSYIFSPNELINEEMVVSANVSTINDEINITFSSNINSALITAMELDKLINSYNNVNFEFEDFNKLIDCLNQFGTSLIYIIAGYITRQYTPTESAPESLYNNEAVVNFLNFLEEELNREIFTNAIIGKYVDVILNKKKYIISLNAKTFNRLGYIIIDYIFSPETNKFKRINFSSSIKGNKIESIKELSISNITDFISALKTDLGSLFKKNFSESKFKQPPKGFVFNLGKYKSEAVFSKNTNEYEYLDALDQLPEGVEYNQESDNYIIKYVDINNKKLVGGGKDSMPYSQRKGYKSESLKTVPRNLEYNNGTTAPSSIANAPNADLGMAKPITNGVRSFDGDNFPSYDQFNDEEDMVVSEPVDSNPEIEAPVIPVGTVEELEVTEAYPQKELMFLSENTSDAEYVINIIKSEGIESAINLISSKYYEETENVTVTDNYIEDLGVDSGDIIETSGDYTLIYDPINLEVSLLKNVSNIKIEMNKIKSSKYRKEKRLRMENNGMAFNGSLNSTSVKDMASLSKPIVSTNDGNIMAKMSDPASMFDGQPNKETSGNTVGSENLDSPTMGEAEYSEVDSPKKLSGKVIIFLSEDEDESRRLISRINNNELENVVDEIIEKYIDETNNVTTTNDYIKDLEINSEDTIEKVGEYTVVYNSEENTFAIFKDYEDDDVDDIIKKQSEPKEASDEEFEESRKNRRTRRMESRKNRRTRRMESRKNSKSIKAKYIEKLKYKKESEEVDMEDDYNEGEIIPEEINEDELDLSNKEIVYLAEDEDEAAQIIDLISTDPSELGEDEDGNPITGVQAAINYIMDIYNETPEENNQPHVTDDYLNDLEIDSDDIIEKEGSYILIYDPENLEVVLLREVEELLTPPEDDSDDDFDEGDEVSKLGGESTGNAVIKDEMTTAGLNSLWTKKYGYSNNQFKASNLMENKKVCDKLHKYFSEKNIKFDRKNMKVTSDSVYNKLKSEMKVKSYINVKVENNRYKVGVFDNGNVKVVRTK